MKIDIETQTFVRFWLVVIGFAAVIGAIYLSISALILIGIALFLALALNPPVSWLAHKLPGKSRVGATAIAYLFVVTFLGTAVFLVVPPIVEQSSKFAETVPGLIDKATSQKPALDDFLHRYNLTGAFDQAVSNAKNQAAQASQQLAGSLVGFVTGAVGWIISLFLVLVLGFVMLIEGPNWMDKFWGLYEDPEKLADHRATVEKMYRVVTGFVTGQLTVAAIAAVVVFLALLVMSQIPHLAIPTNLALPLAFIVLLMEVIPMVGAPLATVLIGLVLLLNSPFAALVFVVFYILYQQVENNFIAPRIQSKNVELSVLWILIAILIGSTVFGLIGGLVAIPIAGSLRVLLMDYLARAKRKREQSKGPKGLVKQLLKRAAAED